MCAHADPDLRHTLSLKSHSQVTASGKARVHNRHANMNKYEPRPRTYTRCCDSRVTWHTTFLCAAGVTDLLAVCGFAIDDTQTRRLRVACGFKYVSRDLMVFRRQSGRCITRKKI